MDKNMEKVLTAMPMAINITGSGKMTKSKVKDSFNMPMVIAIQVTLSKAKSKDMGLTNGLMETYMKGSLPKTPNMVKGNSKKLTVKTSYKEFGKTINFLSNQMLE